uniref:Uncharacterized protein n=2 Tax=Oryza sativa subsp. japonica TaxID=39947 RepID=Q6ENZ5_ORYSJ|nr:hypothetical protein [Oryza sativa Japonica Group]
MCVPRHKDPPRCSPPRWSPTAPRESCAAPGSSEPCCLELYHGKLAIMPLSSKMEFCEFCVACARNRSKLDVKPRVAAASEPDAAAEEKLRRGAIAMGAIPAGADESWHTAYCPAGSDELKTQATHTVECLYVLESRGDHGHALAARRQEPRCNILKIPNNKNH